MTTENRKQIIIKSLQSDSLDGQLLDGRTGTQINNVVSITICFRAGIPATAKLTRMQNDRSEIEERNEYEVVASDFSATLVEK